MAQSIENARKQLSQAKRDVIKLMMRAFDAEFPDENQEDLSWEEAIHQATTKLMHLARELQQAERNAAAGQ